MAQKIIVRFSRSRFPRIGSLHPWVGNRILWDGSLADLFHRHRRIGAGHLALVAILSLALSSCRPPESDRPVRLLCERETLAGIEAAALVFQQRYGVQFELASVNDMDELDLLAEEARLFFQLDSLETEFSGAEQERIGFIGQRSVVMIVRRDYVDMEAAFGTYLVSPAGQKILKKEGWSPRFRYKRILQFDTPGSK